MDNTLEIKIQSTLKQVIPMFDDLTKKINGTETAITKMTARVNKNGDFAGLTVNMKKAGDEAEKTGNKIKKALTFTGALYGVKKTFGLLGKTIQESIDYSEDLNLFNVAMGDMSKQGMRFQNTINEAFGTNQQVLLRYQGLFQAMSTSMGIANEQAYMLSENFIKLGLDLASLYNISDESAMQKLRAGLAGQTKPLRDIGLDITEQSLLPIINRLGIKNNDGSAKTVRQFSQSEKMILRYIAVMEQSTVTHGDFANTINAPANQMKIFGMQVKETSRAIGDLFIGVIAGAMPYVNGFLMAIKEVFKALASFLGIKATDYNTSIGSMADSFTDIEDSIGASTSGAKKLKNILFGFDEINNINMPDLSGGIGVVGAFGGIDSSLLNAMSEYDNLMLQVNNKANAIRDNLLSWFGLTRNVNEETGEVDYSFKLTAKSLVGIGGSLLLGGKLVSSFAGGVKGVLTKMGFLKEATKVVGVETAKTFGGTKIIGNVGLLKTALGNLVKTAAPYAALIAVAGGMTYKFLEQFLPKDVKNINVFGEGISKITKEKLKPFIDTLDSTKRAVDRIQMSNIFSQSDYNLIKDNLEKTSQVLRGEYLEGLNDLEEQIRSKKLFPELSDEEREEKINSYRKGYEKKIKDLDKHEKEVYKIIETAFKEQRKLTEEELKIINDHSSMSQTQAVRIMSDSAIEQQLILDRLKQNSTRITKEQYSQIIKEAIKSRDENLKLAEENRKEQEKALAYRFYVLGEMTEEEYKKELKNIETQYNEEAKKTNEGYDKIVQEVKDGMGEMKRSINYETGEIKSNWTILKEHFTEGWGKIFGDLGNWWTNFKNKITGKHKIEIEANVNGNFSSNGGGGGNRFADGGFPTTGQMFIAREAGPELVGTMGGKTAVANNDQIITGIKQGVYEAVSSAMRNGGSTIKLDIKTEEGIIVKKAIDGINGITNQTGEFPLNVW